MSKEIERKFLIKPKHKHLFDKGELYRQGYLFSDQDKVVRVRVIDNKGFLAVKSKLSGFTRDEFEYEIPAADAEHILNNLCLKPLIEKYRTKILVNDFIWEVDKFIGDNDGLFIAEVELEDEKQIVILPEWIDKEVTGDSRYYNSNLVKNPFCKWKNS
jgi:adenylate cyclase